MKKRVLSIALALLMVLALLPFGALAAEEPITAPYAAALRQIRDEGINASSGLFVDLDDDSVPELLISFRHVEGDISSDLVALVDGKPERLYNLALIRGDYEFSPEDYQSLSVVNYKGSRQLMAMRMQYYAAEVDPEYGQLYWDTGELWFYRFADGKLSITDHWSYRFHELEDGRYFEGEGGIRHNGYAASAEELDKMMQSVSVQQTVSIFDNSDGYTINQLLRVTKGGFVDVPSDQYFAEPVKWAAANGITNGTSDYEFSPANPCTRGQVVTFLWRAAGCPEPESTKNPFKDVKKDAYYYKAVLWAVEQGITNGTSETTFSPGDPGTRGQVVTFIYRNAGSPKISAKNPFRDVKSGAYFYDAVLWAVKNEITNGTSKNEFSPAQTCTRGQIVTFLYRGLAEK